MNQWTLLSGPAPSAVISFSLPSQRNAGLRESLTWVFSISWSEESTLAMSYSRRTWVKTLTIYEPSLAA